MCQKVLTKEPEWFAPYRELERIAYAIIDAYGGYNASGEYPEDANVAIRGAAEALAAQHKGDPAWERAYREWCLLEHENESQTKEVQQ